MPLALDPSVAVYKLGGSSSVTQPAGKTLMGWCAGRLLAPSQLAGPQLPARHLDWRH